MLLARVFVDVVVGAHRMIAHVGGVGRKDKIRTPFMLDDHGLVRTRVGVVTAHAALGDKITIMFQHVEMIVVDNALYFLAEVVLGVGHAEVGGLALNSSGFQSGATSATSQSRTLGSRTFSAPGPVLSAACVQSTQI